MTTTTSDAAGRAASQPAKTFGTFLGVYTPSVLTILGVMMYLRFGWVIGNMGLPLTLLTVLLASSITFITGLSASAISTNMRVGVGGEYFMVSRSLGLELGGAIGIPLFLCRTLSLTLYAFGLAESVSPFWPEAWGAPPVPWITALIIVLTTAIAGKSADLSLKLQLPIMIAVGLSLVALAVGVIQGGVHAPEMTTHFERSAPEGFWFVFAVFFPAVTGFTAGIGMSGDLADPQRSIPRGTILAVLTGIAVYLGIMLLLAFSARVDGDRLAVLDPNAPPVWGDIAFLGMVLIYPGLWGAILSSAFGSALGGPRVLQALALDGIAPRFLGRTSRSGQPTIATWVAGGIALAAVALGDLNAVGRWVTIFFLTLYVTINLSAALERLVGDVSFRPTIRVPWFVSLLGSAGAVVVMFLINPVACLSAAVVELGIYLALRRRAFQTSFGDVRAGMWAALARFALLNLRRAKEEARNWRPHILLFTANPAHRMGLVRMANWFNQNRGVVTVCQTIQGDLDEMGPRLDAIRRDMERAMDEQGMVAFCEAHVVPDFESGLLAIAQANGIAGMESNTVMFGWAGDAEGLARQLRMTRALSTIRRNTIMASLSDREGPDVKRRIDVWWRGMRSNGDLMLLLAHLLALNHEWRQARITVRTIVDDEADRAEMVTRLEAMIRDARIHADYDVLTRPGERTVFELMHAASDRADVVFVGLPIPEPGQELEAARRLRTMVDGFSTTILVNSAGPFAGQLL